MSINPCKKCGASDRYKDGKCRQCSKKRNEEYRLTHSIQTNTYCNVCGTSDRYKSGICKVCHKKALEKYRIKVGITKGKPRRKIIKGVQQTPAEISARRSIYTETHKEKIALAGALWRKENPEIVRINWHNRRALEKSAFGNLSKDLEEKLFKLQKGKCACCKLPLGDNYHLDHIMPLKLGGTNTDDNIQLLRASCNQRKSAKHPVDYMQSKGFLL